MLWSQNKMDLSEKLFVVRSRSVFVDCCLNRIRVLTQTDTLASLRRLADRLR